GALSRPPRRHASRSGPWDRHRRGRQRNRVGGTAVSADPAGRPDRRPHVRDHLPRRGGSGVRVHVRIAAGARRICRTSTAATAAPSAIEPPATAIVSADPEASPVPSTAYGTVLRSAPTTIAPAKA